MSAHALVAGLLRAGRGTGALPAPGAPTALAAPAVPAGRLCAALLVVVALLVGLGAARRARWRRISSSWLEGGAAPRARSERPRRWEPADLSLLVSEVAARLEAGAPAGGAWSESWRRAGPGKWDGMDEEGVPLPLARLAAPRPWYRAGGARSALEALRHRAVARRMATAASSVCAACRFTHRLGAPLARVLMVIADGVDDAEDIEEARRIASAGPRASARALTALPAVGIVVAWALGADPWGTLTSGGAGSACGVVGLLLLVAGHAVSARLLARLRSRDGAVDEAIACDLVLAGLRCGASIPQALAALGGAVGSDGLVRISRELRLGAGWAAAWDPAPPGTELLREGLEAAWLQGVSPEAQLRRAAAQTRRHRISDAKKAAEELGISLVAPLGALLLPAFVLLGLVPIVIHMFAGILGGV